MEEQDIIIAPIEVDALDNAHCKNIIIPHRFVEYKGCLCSISRYTENTEGAEQYPWFCFCPDTIDISYTGVAEKGKDGLVHVGNYVYSQKLKKSIIAELIGKRIIVTKIHPIMKKESNYKGVIINSEEVKDKQQDDIDNGEEKEKKKKNRKKEQHHKDSFIYYLIDTNAFIDCPEILDRIDGKTNRIIIANQVIIELDGLKKSDNQDVSSAARKSTNNIYKVSGYTELLFAKTKEPYVPFESPCTADQKILAAAFLDEFQEKNIVVITSDKNMLLTAKAYGIPAQSLEEFLSGNVIEIKRKKKTNWKKIRHGVGYLLTLIFGIGIGIAIKSRLQNPNTSL